MRRGFNSKKQIKTVSGSNDADGNKCRRIFFKF